MRAVILCAGTGWRLGALGRRHPKPMVALGGRPVLESNVALARDAGIVELCMNLHHLPDVVWGHFGDGRRFGVRISWSYEPELRGTGGALEPFREQLAEDRFVVIYGDNHFTGRLDDVVAAHAASGAIATIAATWRDDVRRSGELLTTPDGWLQELREKPGGPRPRAGWVNAGIVVAEPALLDHVPRKAPSDLAGEVIPRALAAGMAIRVVPFPGQVLWIDTPDDLARARARLGDHSR